MLQTITPQQGEGGYHNINPSPPLSSQSNQHHPSFTLYDPLAHPLFANMPTNFDLSTTPRLPPFNLPHSTVLSPRRHPAEPSVRADYFTPKRYLHASVVDYNVPCYCSKKSRQRNAMPSYWIRQERPPSYERDKNRKIERNKIKNELNEEKEREKSMPAHACIRMCSMTRLSRN